MPSFKTIDLSAMIQFVWAFEWSTLFALLHVSPFICHPVWCQRTAATLQWRLFYVNYKIFPHRFCVYVQARRKREHDIHSKSLKIWDRSHIVLCVLRLIAKWFHLFFFAHIFCFIFSSSVKEKHTKIMFSNIPCWGVTVCQRSRRETMMMTRIR